MESLMLVGLVPQGTELLEQRHIVAAISNSQAPATEAIEAPAKKSKKKTKSA
jgi:hypothetical protein